MSHRLVARATATVIGAWMLFVTWPAVVGAAGPPPWPTDGLPVITAGRDNEILALIRPWALGGEIVPGWFLDSIEVQPTGILFRCKTPAGEERSLLLGLPERMPEVREHTLSFALQRSPADAPAPAPDPLDVLAAAVEANDTTKFWPDEPPEDSPGHPRDEDVSSPSATQWSHGSGRPFQHVAADWVRRARDRITDGVFLFLGALLFLLLHLRRQLRRDPPWVAAALLGLVIAGAVLRVILPHENIMEAWPYQRLAPLASRIYSGSVLAWLNAVSGGSFYLSDVLFKSNYLLAVLTPLTFFALGRYILGDYRSALVASALLVVLPMHLRFSRSDVYMIQSIATSSLTFVVLYIALTDVSRAWRVVSFAILPVLCAATYFVRPENIIFVVLDLGAIYICTYGTRRSWSRTSLAVLIVTGTAALAFVFNLLAHYRGNIDHGLSLQTLQNAVYILFNRRLNTLVNPWIIPPGVTALAVLGGVSMWRRGDRQRAVFLVAWLGGFFLVHSFVVPYHPAMQARYHMNLITPLILLAAASTPVILSWRRVARYAVFLYLAASPWIHEGFITDTAFNEMRELTFLTTLRERIPADCTVIEYRGMPGEGQQAGQFASRMARVSSRLAGGRVGQHWNILSAATVDYDLPVAQQVETLSSEVAAVLEEPPPCLVFYEGLTCASLRREGQERTPICQTIRDRLDLVPIASTSFASRVYDPVNSGYLGLDASGHTFSITTLPDGSPITLTAYRARRRREVRTADARGTVAAGLVPARGEDPSGHKGRSYRRGAAVALLMRCSS